MKKASTKLNKRLSHLLVFALTMTSISATAGETIRYVHTDHLGTPIVWTDQDGNVIKTAEYEPYGLQVSGPVEDGPGYTGHVEDAATGLTYMQQRYYDPQIGMFLSVDPVTAYGNPVGQFNRYRYANGNPYMYTDPDGRFVFAAIAIVGVAITAYDTYQTYQQEGAAAAAKSLAIDGAIGLATGGTGKLLLKGGKALFRASKAGANAAKNTAVQTGSTLKPGPFANESVPARGSGRNFTRAERDKINEAGAKDGCHTCGTTDPGTKSGDFVPDHQPPNAMNPSGGQQQLYPHCKTCSTRQGGQVTQAKRSPEPL